MLFNSFHFIFIFFPIVFFGFNLIGKFSRELCAIWLCAASLYFFCQWNAHYVWLLLFSITINYSFGLVLNRIHGDKSRIFLILSICINLLVLGYYKYAGFLTENIGKIFGVEYSFGQIILPLGISFFTFTQVAYLVDSHRGKVKEQNFIHYILFVTYFPHLIAGPILHHAQMMPQFRLKETYKINWENCTKGLMMFIIGLAKKMLLADLFATYAKPVFDSAQSGNTPLLVDSWMGVLAYGLQLYFDFSGYCDMAIGISLFFNIKLPFNFNSPYKAINIIDFWRRWHMTLSIFLRDYLYIPLGGNRHGNFRRYFNVIITMLIGGLWHGAGWTFIIWGGLHGLYLAINHGFHDFRRNQKLDFWLSDIISLYASRTLTFFAVTVAWVFFRSPDLQVAEHMLGGMIGKNNITLFQNAHIGDYIPIYFGLIIVWFFPNSQEWMELKMDLDCNSVTKCQQSDGWRWKPNFWLNWAIFGIIFAICLLELTNGKPSQFLYFQF